jgi:large exoprotein involved in heme utilization and adhesion
VIQTNGEIAASTHGAGNGGQVAVDVAGGLVINAAGSNLKHLTGIAAQNNPGSTGNAGSVTVRAGSLTIERGASIAATTYGQGAGGDVSVDVTGTGARALVIRTSGEIDASTNGAGNGGQVAVDVAGGLVINGAHADPRFATGILAQANPGSTGTAGDVTVASGNLLVENGAEIAGSTAGSGTGGNVAVNVGSEIVLSGLGPQITAQSTGSGNAGSVDVSAYRLVMTDGAAISTGAVISTANARNITLSIRDLLYLVDSAITTSVMGETGNGGNITIDSGLLVLDHSQIIAQAEAGNGGNITINRYAGAFVASTDSTVSASSQTGISGVVEINGITPLNGALVALSSELRRAVALTTDSCAARAGRPQSSLVEAGRGGLPQDPEASLPALYIAGRDVRIEPRVAPPRTYASGEPRPVLRVAMGCGLN